MMRFNRYMCTYGTGQVELKSSFVQKSEIESLEFDNVFRDA